MPKFTATIELHNAGKEDYETLNTELVKASFKDSEQSSGKKAADAVRKEYSRVGNISLQDVAASVSKAASKTGKKYSFIVMRNKHFYN